MSVVKSFKLFYNLLFNIVFQGILVVQSLYKLYYIMFRFLYIKLRLNGIHFKSFF